MTNALWTPPWSHRQARAPPKKRLKSQVLIPDRRSNPFVWPGCPTRLTPNGALCTSGNRSGARLYRAAAELSSRCLLGDCG